MTVLVTYGILIILIVEAFRFFNQVSIFEFLFGLQWAPAAGSFGIIPLLTGTIMITGIALCVAVPLGLFSAIYLAEYVKPRWRTIIKPILEILTGIPTVVYGFFAAITVGPALHHLGVKLGLSIAAESALGVGLVMGLMIVPYISSLADDVFTTIPQAVRDGSFGLGATQSETIKKVLVPAALPGLMAAILLAMSRAVGETMLVVMAAGLSARLTLNPLEAVTTFTVQIVNLLGGDQEFSSPKTLAAFALGLLLFLSTLVLNVIAFHVVRKYRHSYE